LPVILIIVPLASFLPFSKLFVNSMST
ncbi:hypothetical protein ACN38_g12986, partial [Penicillium nordicum]